MRSRRLSFLLLALYFVFIGGSAYYTLIFPVRVFHHIFVSGLMVLWYFRRWRGDGLPSTPLNVVLLAAVIVRVFTAATAFDPRMAFEHLWFVFLHLTIFFVLVDLFQRGRQRIIMETQFMLGALVVLITVLELASWYFGLGILPGAEVGWVDVIGPGAWLPTKPLQVSLAMNISTLLAGYVAPLITLTIGWALTARQRDYRQVLWLLASGLIVVLIFTFSRGGILSLAAGLGSLAAMRIAQAPRIKRIVSPAVVLGAAVTGGVLLVVLLTVFQTQTLGDRVRLDMYRSASEMLVDYPVTGVGTGGFGRAYREYRSVNQLTRDRLASAHNFYLNTAAETGFPGIIVMVWFGVVTVRTWWATWRSQATSARKLRVEATIAALIGVCIHSLVDVFTTTPVVSLIVLLLAYSVVGHRTVLDDRPKGVRWAAGVCGLIALGYAVFLLQIDRAQSLYEGSMRQGDDALDMAYQAESIDPSLNLYDLQIAYLLGIQAHKNPSPENLERAIEAYEMALEIEPTWDTGWVNLAALLVDQGDLETATTYLETARDINPITNVGVPLGMIADRGDTRSAKDIRLYYRSGMHWVANNDHHLPLASWWKDTLIRRDAIKAYIYLTGERQLDRVYLVAFEHMPSYAANLVEESPKNALEYWIAGHHAYYVENDPVRAHELYSEAISRNRNRGDFYVYRAITQMESDPEAALRDLNLARLVGTEFQSTNFIEAQMVSDVEEHNQLLVNSVRLPSKPQHFAAVLYGGRPAIFDFPTDMRYPGPSREIMQPWYQLAEKFLADERIEDATRVYEAIVDVAPAQQDARTALNTLRN